MELLNLDELTTVDRFVTLRGKRYAVNDRSVGQMLESVVMAKRAGTHTEEEFLESMISTVQSVIPDCPVDTIRSMNLRQMVALLEFVNQDPSALVAQAEAQAQSEGKSGNVESVVDAKKAASDKGE